ncbi:methyltransferase domain-containing protein [Asticcacaulis sp.]|uniref:methyltransferase domain-containing protein n=1 Tax=Asticcacaulis sp. TaxID=1872648 RepID=UPI00261C058E|nr:methyltransferase domain-containing protein [Asticcacaulis sp.]
MSLPSTEKPASIVLKPPFTHDAGQCWRVAIDPTLFSLTDDVGFTSRSTLTLREDDQLLGPAHASHGDIRLHGGGRYSHWRHTLYFSARDGSDPNVNGRTYEVRESAEEHYRERAQYAMQIVAFYARYLTDGMKGFRDLQVLEVGPGMFLGSVLAMACLGARVTVVDPFLPDWKPDIHSMMAASLEVEMRKAGWDFDPSPLHRSVAAGQLDRERVRTFRQSLESIAVELDGQIDLTVSHATFEHLFDVKSAMAAMVRTMKPNGKGIHRVDYRDHDSFDRPLEFLLMSQQAYDQSCGDNKYGRGNRMRAETMRDILINTGLRHVQFTPETLIEEGYLNDFLARLRSRPDSTFHSAPVDHLRVLGGTFIVQK